MTTLRASSALVLCAVWMASSAAVANLRGPDEVVVTPSGALLPGTPDVGDRVRVLRETLKLRCTLQLCHVQAVYVLDASEPLTLETALVLGSPEPVVVTVSDTSGRMVRTTVTPVLAAVHGEGPVAKDLARVQALVGRHHFSRDLAPPHLAPMTLALGPGRSEISLAYQQPTGKLEVDYGYFFDGHWIRTVDYHLWPLNGWRRAPGFVAQVEVRFVAPPRGLWHRMTSGDDRLRCWTRSEDGSDWGDRANAEREAVLKTVLRAAPLPDVLLCQMGEGA